MLSIFWAIVLIVTIVLEICTMQLTSIWFSLGALISMIVSLFNGSFPLQLTIFIIISVLSLILTRPLIKKIKVKTQPTNHELNVGKIAIVIETINKANQTGRVSLDGVNWSAVTETFEPINVGSRVVVEKVDGAKLWVSKV